MLKIKKVCMLIISCGLLACGCSSQVVEELPHSEYELTVDVSVDNNLFLARDNIVVSLDGEKQGVILHGDSYNKTFLVEEGSHSLRFEKENSSSSYESYRVDVESNCLFRCSIKSRTLGLDLNNVEVIELLDDDEMIDIAVGTYYGEHESLLNLYKDGTCDYYNNGRYIRDEKWKLVGNKIKWHSIDLDSDIYAVIYNMDSSEIALISEDSNWIDETYYKLSSEPKKMTIDEKMKLIKYINLNYTSDDVIAAIDSVEIDDSAIGKIDALNYMYESLKINDKAKVTNYDKIFLLENEYNNYIEEKEETERIGIIDNIVEIINEISIEEEVNEDLVLQARSEYELLDDEEKALITNYDKLLEAEEVLSDKRVAEIVKMINEINVENIKVEDEKKIKKIEKKYKKLSDEEKEKIDNYDVLLEARSIVDELVKKRSDEEKEEQNKISEKLKGFIGKKVEDLLPYLDEIGYKAEYKAANTGDDFTELLTSYDKSSEWYSADVFSVKEIKEINHTSKKVNIIVTTEEIEKNLSKADMNKKLSKVLDPIVAWEAAQNYGETLYGRGFKIHYFLDKLAETAEDESTWFLKAGCTVKINGQKYDCTCEAEVTGTDNNPEVIYFNVY